MLLYIFKSIMVNNYLLLLILRNIIKSKDIDIIKLKDDMLNYIFGINERKEI